VLGRVGSGVGKATKMAKNDIKSDPEKVFSGAPGRGVLRFLTRAYRRPVHFLPFFAIFSENLQI